ncbi:MAG: carbamoyltransferase [Actinomycetota bacterium]|nr:carbamoyltransferase [Actinomycetota bacterium]
MNILGINCFSHDTAAALLQDGVPVAFVEEERFNREKHTKAFPDAAIEFCLRQGGIGIKDVDVVVFSHRIGLDFRRGAADALKRMPRGWKRLGVQTAFDLILLRKQQYFVRKYRYRGRVVNVGHHEAHAASAFYASGFDEAAVLTLDRGGDFLSTTLGHGKGTRLDTLHEVRNPDSLGEVYTALTWFLGFHPNADEGKVMGLAPYGRDRRVEEFRDLIHLTPDGLFTVNLDWFAYHLEGGWVSRRFTQRFGAPRVPESEMTERDEDLACAVQAITEEAGLHLANALHRLTGSKNLALAGGVALNSVMNARLLAETPFEHIFIQPAAGDAGNALGAALLAWHQLVGKPREWRMEHAFLGPEPPETDFKQVLTARDLPFREVADPAAEAARLLADSKIVGWFQGRAEVGPRALGARSILADPRKAEMKDIVNAEVKHREGFRPFAPAVLDEHGADYFEGYYPNPFMLLVLPIRPDKRDVIPAVTHVDGTGRLQSVMRDSNPAFHRLIEHFRARTGVPVVLNTSYNLRGEPIVNTPQEAVDDYLNTGMDALVLGPYVLEKPQSER